MKHLSHILLFILVLAFTNRGEATTVSAHQREQEKAVKAVADDDYPSQPTHHIPYRSQLSEHPSPIAMLSNPQNNYRFSHSRPQRIIPVQGNKQQRGNGKTSAAHLFYQHQKSHCGIVEGCLSASFMPVVSCKDIFLVLRHIIR